MKKPALKGFVRGRSWSRRFAMQALYQRQLGGQDVAVIEAEFMEDQEMDKADQAYFHELLSQVVARLDAVNDVLRPFLDRPLEQVDPVERAILWIGGYELLFRPDIPYRVVINEGVELAKQFGAEQGHRFINGVLDKAAHRVRAQEINPSHEQR
jgi:transcription antitermination protein NusB